MHIRRAATSSWWPTLAAAVPLLRGVCAAFMLSTTIQSQRDILLGDHPAPIRIEFVEERKQWLEVVIVDQVHPGQHSNHEFKLVDTIAIAVELLDEFFSQFSTLYLLMNQCGSSSSA